MSIQDAWKAFDDMLASHEGHQWKQIGRCVYCHDCDVRLYQGTIPRGQLQHRQVPREPKATTEMRKRWGKE